MHKCKLKSCVELSASIGVYIIYGASKDGIVFRSHTQGS